MTQERRRHFHEALDQLQDRLLEMAGEAEELVRKSAEALLTRNALLAKEVRKGDQVVDDLEQQVDDQVVELLALQQPMAVDLRRVVVALKIANDLERVGDHAVNIAKATKRMMDYPPLPELPEVAEMLRISQGMLADCLAAYVSRNPGLARDVHARDDRVDNLRRSLYRILVSHMLEEPRRISPALELLLVSQNIERIADLSTNIAEDVVFLVEGKPMRQRVVD